MVRAYGYIAFINNEDYRLNVSSDGFYKGNKIKQEPTKFPAIYQRITTEGQGTWISCNKEEFLQMCYIKREQIERAIKILEESK